jgi:hypothetical protein
MSRSIFALFFVAVFAISLPFGDVSLGSELDKAVRVPANLGFAVNVSPDAQAATILFDNLWVTVGPTQKGRTATLNQTAIQTKLATLNIPYKTDQRSVTMTMDLRGFADADPAASVRLVACVGNATKVVDLSSDEAKKIELKGKSKCTVCEEYPDAQFGDWQDRIEFTVQTHAAKPVLQVTLFLLVEHDTDAAEAGGALLAIDSLDLEIAKPAKAAYKP